ncbi:hypothetical protein ACFQH8_13080 [Halomicroarcula sp. GCM10025710]
MIEQLLGDDVESSGRYLAEVIYGANDGIVTTFAVVSGVAGASSLDGRGSSTASRCSSSACSRLLSPTPSGACSAVWPDPVSGRFERTVLGAPADPHSTTLDERSGNEHALVEDCPEGDGAHHTREEQQRGRSLDQQDCKHHHPGHPPFRSEHRSSDATRSRSRISATPRPSTGRNTWDKLGTVWI